MTVRTKLIGSYALVALLVGGATYLALVAGQHLLQREIGESAVRLSGETLDKIDRLIDRRIEDMRVYARDLDLAGAASASSRDFDDMRDAGSFIRKVDDDWKAGKETPFIEDLLSNPLSKRLTRHYEFLEEEHGYPVLGEMYVTNKYGVAVASTTRLSDYLQADEEWYRRAMGEEEFWVGELEYDRSSGTYAIDIVVKLYDEKGGYAGIFKAPLNIEEVKGIVGETRSVSPYESLEPHLVDGRGLTIFSGLDPSHEDAGRDPGLDEFGEEMASHEGVKRALEEGSGFLVFERDGKRVLSAFGRSKGYGDFDGSGWSLVMDYDAGEILAPLSALKRVLLAVSGCALFLAVCIGLAVSRGIARPLARMEKSTIALGRGELETRVEITSKDELGVLARSFNTMAANLKEYRDQLVSARDRIRNIIGSMDDSLVVVGPDNRIVSANRATVELLGYREEDLAGKPVETLFETGDFHFRGAKLGELLREGAIRDLEMEYRRSSGETVPVSFSCSVMRDDGGKITGSICIARDISARKRMEAALRKSEERYRRLVENLGGDYFFYSHGTDGVFTYVSPSLSGVLGYEPEEFVSHYSTYLIDSPVNRKVVRHTELSMKGVQQPPYQVEIRHKDGSIRGLEVLEFPVFDEAGKVVAVEGIAHDLTERMKLERELTEKTRALGERVKELDCLYEALKVMSSPDVDLDGAMTRLVGLIPDSWRYPSSARARISVSGRTYEAGDFKETDWFQSSDIIVSGEKAGSVQVYYLREMPAAQEGPFLAEERALLEALAIEIGRYIERITAAREREELIRELKTAVSRVRTLSGLLPICAWCKKIRDDEGYWHRVEDYVKDHSDAEFSHGLCPECARKLDPSAGTRKEG